ncbi:MAG: SIMPL domain-containing protein [Ignavibacteriota bacterium]
MKITSRFLIAVAITILTVPSSIFAQRSITVTGKGTVTAKPDHAIVTMMLTSQNNTAQTVFSLNDENTSRLMKSLSDAGVAPEDVEQRTFALNPTYDYSSGGGAPPRLVGYHMMATYQVKVRNLKALPVVLDAGTVAGANNVTIEGYSITNKEKLEGQATKEAINDAREAAGRLAKEMGGALGDILAISDAEASAGAAGGGMEREEEERRGPGMINPKEVKKKVELRVTFSVK